MLPAHIDLTSVDTPTDGTIRLEDLRRIGLLQTSHSDFRGFVDDRLALLGRTIVALGDLYTHLSGVRNASTQIHRTPPELLAIIFSYLVDSDADLVGATHVCRKWRSVALDSSRLWTRIYVTNLEKAEAYILRSRRQLVDVYFMPSPDHTIRKFSRMLRTLASRLRTLVVETLDTSTVSYLMSALGSLPAPHLETLHLLGEVASDSDRHVVDLFRGGRELFIVNRSAGAHLAHTPVLRSLRLHPIGLRWDTDLFRGLSELELRVPDMRPPSQRRILEILKQCPGLEILNLDLAALTEPIVPRYDPSWDVHLPSLSKCVLVSLPPDKVSALLSYMILPPTTRFKIVTSERVIGLTYAVLPRNRSRLPGLVAIHTMEFMVDIPNELIHIHCYHPSIGGLGDPVLILELSIHRNAGTLLSALPENFDLSELHTLVVSGLDHPTLFNNGVWGNIFPSSTKLRTLRLVSLCSTVIRGAFQELVHPRAPEGPACRELSDVELVDIWFDEKWLAASLIRLATKRKDLGFPLERVELLGASDVSEWLITGLRASGVTVAVDEN